MKILLINGHPSEDSFCYALSQAYKQGAQSAGAEVREINVGNLKFSPNLAHGYRKITELEEDLIHAQDSITWAEHLVFVYPTCGEQCPPCSRDSSTGHFCRGLRSSTAITPFGGTGS